MALTTCTPIAADMKGRELVEHGTALFPVACYHTDLDRMEVAWHWHEDLEVFTVERGTARASVNGSEYILKAGEGFFINAGVLHGVRQEGTEPCRLHSIVFHPRLVGGSIDSIIWQKYLEPLITDQTRPCARFWGSDGYQGAAIRAIETAWQSCVLEEEGFELAARELLSQVVLLLFKNRPLSEKAPSAAALRDGERTKTMLQFIQEHFGEEISLTQIAQSAHISQSECLRCFRNVIGHSPIQYVKQLRIQKAAELLLCTDDRISDIGQQCGFQEMSYFAKAFRELRGCTPSEYREWAKENE